MKPFCISEGEAASLFGAASVVKGRRAAVKKKREALPENQVESQVLGFLRSRGWLVERQQAGVVVGIGPLLAALDRGQVITRELLYRSMIRQGEKGRCDWVAVRPYGTPANGDVQRMEIEIKASGKKPSPEQIKYIRDRMACGFLATWCDSLESFVRWYGERFS